MLCTECNEHQEPRIPPALPGHPLFLLPIQTSTSRPTEQPLWLPRLTEPTKPPRKTHLICPKRQKGTEGSYLPSSCKHSTPKGCFARSQTAIAMHHSPLVGSFQQVIYF